jgi:uncharacterized protein
MNNRQTTRTRKATFLVAGVIAISVIGQGVTSKEQGSSTVKAPVTQEAFQKEAAYQKEAAQSDVTQADLHRAAASGNLATLRARLREGMKPDVRDQEGRTPLMDAVRAGQVEAAQVLLEAGANPNAASSSGRTSLIEAAESGSTDAAQLLIDAGAELNVSQPRFGNALETAERTGHNELAALLLKAGARSSGKSIGDTVCVRPWAGSGYCGIVEEIQKTAFRIRVTEIVGCEEGCPAKAECSEDRPVGGPKGIGPGDEITTVSWCLTHTGVK